MQNSIRYRPTDIVLWCKMACFTCKNIWFYLFFYVCNMLVMRMLCAWHWMASCLNLICLEMNKFISQKFSCTVKSLKSRIAWRKICMFLLKTADENVKRSKFIIRWKFGVNTVITVCGLKAQWADSPGQRPGYSCYIKAAPWRGKSVSL